MRERKMPENIQLFKSSFFRYPLTRRFLPLDSSVSKGDAIATSHEQRMELQNLTYLMFSSKLKCDKREIILFAILADKHLSYLSDIGHLLFLLFLKNEKNILAFTLRTGKLLWHSRLSHHMGWPQHTRKG